jgi:aminoacrylate hydrolase
MERGGHACNVTDSDAFNTLLLSGLETLLPIAEKELL